ncbi:hypothetical protein GBA65_18340 [Rubrobacter marinus]|uniref:Uncharacterized protein n=1 Tax=Rubrobacter marinus TaxID=2653852 RepID=A0A6G8Q109_9ACTN|nr:hypothetical protein [Rubrobacter marinus]QIN80153.1 hypothetical protein GBA65_18340 [Rubrobacter marinus]
MRGGSLLPASGGGRAALISAVAVFLALDVLVLLGSDLALGLLVLMTGLVAGLVLAVLATLPVRRTLERGGLGNLFGFLVGLASMFGIVFLGTYVAGLPSYPTAEAGHLGTALYGFAFGFGATLCGLSLRLPASSRPAYRGTADRDGGDRIWLRTALIVVGAAAGLFGLLFFAFVLFEYVLVPVVEIFAS